MSSDQLPSRQPNFQFSNHQVVNCGTPPQIDSDALHRRTSYYENEHGEQAIFEFDFETRTARMWMGDAGWEQAHPVVNGMVPGFSPQSW